MGKPLRLLIVEDSADDAELTVLELKRGGYEPTFERVDTAEAMSTALDKKTWDVILADYSMPHFSTLAALKLMQEKGLDLPFIIVSGAIGEDTAVAAMRAGAHDYLMKDKLLRLVPAIEREIREAKTRQERKKIEKEKQKLLDQQILVNQFTLALGNFRNLDRIYQIIYKNVRNLMDADAFLVSLYDKAEKLIKAGYVISRETVRDVANFPPIPLEEKGHGTQSQVIHTAKPLYIPDVRKAMKKTGTEYKIAEDGKVSKGAPPPEEQEDSTNSAIYVPMRIKGEVIGVIQVQSRRLDGYRQDDIALLTGMANVAAIAIQNARLYKGIQQELAERKKAEDALRKSETKFKTLTNNVNVGIYRNTTGPKGKFIEANPELIKMFGYKNKEEFLAIKVSDLYQNPADRKKFNEKMLSAGFVKDEELQLKRKDGTPFIGSVSVVAIEDEKGKVKYYDGIIEDITERVKAEEALLESEEKLRLLVKNSLDVIFRIEMDKGYTFMSPSVEQLTGYHPGDYYNDPEFWRKITHPDDIPQVEEMFAAIIEGKNPPSIWELRQFKKDGSPIHLEFTTIAIRDDAGKIAALEGVARDITERKKAEEALASSEEFLNSVIEQSPVSLWISDREGTMIKMNQSCRELFGATGEEAVGKYNLFKDNLIEEQGFMPLVENVFEKGEIARFTIDYDLPRVEHIKVNGATHRILDVIVSPIKDMHGKVTNAIVQHKDITERKLAEEALRESERNLVKGQEITQMGYWKLNPVTEEVEGSDELLKIFGLSRDEMTLDAFADVVHPEDREYDLEHIQRGIEKGIPWDIEHRLLLKNGTIKWIRAIGEPDLDENGKVIHIIGIVQDITDRKQVEEALREASQQWQSTFNGISDVVSVLDLEGRILHSNESITKLVGKPAQETVGCNCCELVHGSTVPVKGCPLMRMKKSHHRETLALPIGDRWFEVVVDPVLDEAGNVISAIHIVSDITERKKMEEQIARSARLSAMGEMIGGVAHELNNPLTSVLGNTQWLLTSKVDPKMLRETLQKIEYSAQKSRKIVADLLEFTKEKAYKFELANINDIVRKSLEMFQDQADISHIEMRTNYEKDGLPVKVSISHIEQIFLNIMTNASQAMPEGGNLTVITLLEDDIVKVKFQDTGVGIEPEDLDKIFNPFYTKKVGSKVIGTGLGLSMAHKIIEKHKGMITTESEGKGKGATFTVALPVDKEGKSRK